MDNLISPEYKALLRKKHDDKPWGGAGHSWIPIIGPLLNRFNEGFTILDFGCGRGTFKPHMLEYRPDAVIYEYDPGVKGKDKLQWNCVDYIVCTDVMEHVEEDKVDITLETLDRLAKWGIFFNIDTAPSKSFLPDGRNTHITIHPSSWWYAKLQASFREMKWKIHRETKSQLVISGVRTWDVV